MDAIYSQQVKASICARNAVWCLIGTRFAKWKRDAETWYQQDSAMFEGLFNSVYINLVRTSFYSKILVPSLLT